MKRLAIIDWGIGGISIYRLVKEQLGLSVVYFSDTGATPYGKMSRAELVARLNMVVAYLKDRGVTHLVIGCNAASTAIPFLAGQSLKIVGMIDNAIGASIKYKPQRLAVIGGRRTVLSGVYRKGFAANGLKIEQRIAQPLSGLIESGDVSSQNLREACKKIFSPIRNCSHILLACTHYPAIIPVLRDYVSADTVLVDPAADLVKKLGEWNLPPSNAKDIFITSGEPGSMKIAAQSAFGVTINSILIADF